MSVTREEAIITLEFAKAYINKTGVMTQSIDVALTALRPVSREQVEKVWRGEWHRHYKSGIHAGNGVVCSKCDMWNNRAAHFCPACGVPMTDEAVDMVMERMEALKDGNGD